MSAAISLTERVHDAGERGGDAVAAIDGLRRSTFREIEERSNRLANALVSLTGGHGRVALMLPNSIEMFEGDLATVKAGLAKVPINQRLVPDEREYVLADSEAAVLITDGEGYESIESALDRLPSLEHVVVVGQDARRRWSYDAVLESASSRKPERLDDPRAPSVILYTSGTTGRPKGAVASRQNRWLTTLAMLREELDIGAGDAMVHCGSMAHGSGSKSLAFWLVGARNIMMRKFDAEECLHIAAAQHATNTFLVPTMIASLLDAAEAIGAARAGFRTISYGGAPISEPLLLRALETFGNVFVQVYGSCEAPHPVTVLRKSDHQDLGNLRAASIGRPTGSSRVQIDCDESADGDSIGEMLIGGDRILSSYWNRPEASSEAIVDGWYKSGDIVRRDADGYLYIVDRKRDVIISGGLNVYPAEIERVVAQHPGVIDVAVVGIPDEHWGEAPVAFVVRKPNAELTDNAILDHCRAHLAGYKLPRLIEFRDDLPKGNTGKVNKRDLRAPYWSGHVRQVN